MSAAPDVRAGLEQGAQALGLDLSEAQVNDLLRYLEHLLRWNQVYNLTAVRNPADMLTHHVLDSLAVVQALRRHSAGRALRVLDVGSGGGLPGVVLALACPELQVTCVDTVAKKAAFVQQVTGALAAGNLRAQHSRVQDVGQSFDLIVSRAFASLADFVQLSARQRAPDGVWMAMKARHPEAEIQALPAEVQVFHVEPLQVPGLQAERCLVWMQSRLAAPTPLAPFKGPAIP